MRQFDKTAWESQHSKHISGSIIIPKLLVMQHNISRERKEYNNQDMSYYS